MHGPVFRTTTSLPSALALAVALTAVPVAVPTAASAQDASAGGRPATPAALATEPPELQFSYRATAFPALERHVDAVDLIIPEWLYIDGDGTISGEAETRVLELARAHRVPVMVQVKNFDRERGVFRADWVHALVTRPDARRRAIDALLDFCRTHRLDGVQIEFEGASAADRDGVTTFVREATDAMHRNGFRVSVSAVHREEDGPGPNSYTAWMWENWRGIYDLEAYGEIADFVRVVVYAQHTRRTPPGPSQSLPWMERVLDRFTAAIPPEKLTVDINMGSMRWFTVADSAQYVAGARTWSEPLSLAQARTLVREAGGGPLRWDDRVKASYGFADHAGVFEWVWTDNDIRSFDARLALLRRYGIPSITMWVTGDEDPGIWQRLGGRRSNGTTGGRTGGGVPVLAWHYFDEAPDADAGALTDTYARLEELLGFLRANGFTSVMPESAGVALMQGRKPVVLTIDDGRKDQLRAAELLEQYGYRGIFFVIPTRAAHGGPLYMTPDEIARLSRAGHRVATHGWDHQSAAYSGEEVGGTVTRALPTLDLLLEPDPAPLDFAFPFGHYTTTVVDAVQRSFRYLHTVNPGYWDGSSVLIPRMLIMRDNDLELYREYLLGASDHAPVLELLSPDGSVGDTVRFRITGPLPGDLELFAVSADATGRSYASHPLGASAHVNGDVLAVDVAAHMRRYYAPDRPAIAFTLAARDGTSLRILSPGVLHWVRDPAGGPRLEP